MTNDLLKIKQKHDSSFELFIKYKQFNSRMEELYMTNIFFSTYLIKGSVDGFIQLADNLFVRVLIIHRLGTAAASINQDIKYKEIVKMKIASKKEQIVLSIFPNVFNRVKTGYLEEKFKIKFPLLSEFYIELALASSQELIIDRQNRKFLNNKDAFNKDLVESDYNRIKWSQNSDGSRNNKEYFSGSGSNIGRKSIFDVKEIK